MWAKDECKAQKQYFKLIEKVVIEHAVKKSVIEHIDDARSWPLIEMAARYYDVKRADGCSPLFLNAVRKHLQRFLDWLKSKGFDICKNTAEGLTSALLSSYRQSLAEDTSIARKTANHYIDYVRMLLIWGANVHGIHHPPLGAIQQFSSRRKAKLGHGRKQDRTPFTWEQLEKLLSAADVTDSALLMLALNCGFGNSDIGKLKLCDVDLENSTISHPRPKTGVHRDFVLWPEGVVLSINPKFFIVNLTLSSFNIKVPHYIPDLALNSCKSLMSTSYRTMFFQNSFPSLFNKERQFSNNYVVSLLVLPLLLPKLFFTGLFLIFEKRPFTSDDGLRGI